MHSDFIFSENTLGNCGMNMLDRVNGLETNHEHDFKLDWLLLKRDGSQSRFQTGLGKVIPHYRKAFGNPRPKYWICVWSRVTFYDAVVLFTV